MDLSFITKFLGGGLTEGIGNVISKFKADPTKIAELETELKKVVLDHEAKMSGLAQQAMDAEIRDKESARSREVALRNTIGVWVQNMSAALVVVVFCTMLFVVLYKGVPPENKELFYTLFGVLGTLTATIFNYWFGSSSSADRKEKQLHDLINKN